jgi:adenylate cyclase
MYWTLPQYTSCAYRKRDHSVNRARYFESRSLVYNQPIAVERKVMAHLSVQLLGPFQVTLDGEPVTGLRSDKVRALLAYLATEASSPQRREKLAGLLWHDWPEPAARANLRQALANLRRSIGDHRAKPPFLHITRKTIQFNRASDAWIDVTAFTDLLETREPPRQAIHQLEEAVDLYRDGFLEGFSIGDSPAFEEWALLNRERLRRLVLAALQRLAQRYQERGEYECALRYAWRQVDLDPWREKAQRQVMRLLALNGQRGAALAQYESCRNLLAENLGVQPAAETVRLYEQIRDGQIEISASLAGHLPDFLAQPSPFLESDVPERLDTHVFVGRERDLVRMDKVLERVREGEGQVFFITGGAGRGKTALLSEFARRSLDTHRDLLLAAGNCNAYSGVGDPYLPFRDVMAMLTGDIEGRWAAGAIDQELARRLWETLPVVVQMLVDRGPQLIDIFLPGNELTARATAAAPGGADWLERLHEVRTRGRPGPGGLGQSLLFEQYANVLRGLATQRPLLIVLDDLQWADAASISLLFHLRRRLAGTRILIAGAYSPDELALDRDGGRHPLEPVLTEFKRQYGDIWIDLAKTEEAEARRFVNAFLDTEPNRLSKSFRQSLFQRTEGHPLFTIELVRAMGERGSLVRDEQGRWKEGPALDWETLPARVEAVIEERIGRLPADLREILCVSSVEGKLFTAQVVARVMQVGERQLLRNLSQELQGRHHLVQEREEVQVGCHHLTRYEFTHAPLQQYLYSGLGAGERRLLHREFARALEEAYEGCTEEIAVHLARHYAGDVERERIYVQVAGERAAAQFANAEALHYLSRALDLTPESDPAGRLALLLLREKVLDLQGERSAQRQDLAALEELARSLDSGGQQASWQQSEVALRKAAYADAISDYPAAISAAQMAIHLAQAGQDTEREAAGYLQWGRVLCARADYEEAQGRLGKALGLARAANARQVEANSLRNLGLVSWLQGRYDEAETYFQDALCIYRESGDRQNEGGTLNNLGIVAAERGSHTEARACYERSLAIFRRVGDRRGEAIVLGNLASNALSLGDYARSEDYNQQTLQICREIGHRAGECRALANLGLLLHQLGKDDSAHELNQRALQIAQDLGDRRWQGHALTNMGHALVGLKRLTEAVDVYRQALDIRRGMGEYHMVLESLAGLARAFLDQGELAQAQEAVEEVLSNLEEHTVEGADEPVRVYLTCYLVLDSCQDARAQAMLDIGHRLLEDQAGRIDDVGLRRSFRENVPAHREIIRLWEAGPQGLPQGGA